MHTLQSPYCASCRESDRWTACHLRDATGRQRPRDRSSSVHLADIFRLKSGYLQIRGGIGIPIWPSPFLTIATIINSDGDLENHYESLSVIGPVSRQCHERCRSPANAFNE